MDSDRFHAARLAMIQEQLRPRGIRDARVLDAMLQVPRHEFIAPKFWHDAYADHPVSIGAGQTISQPYIVAAMLEMLAPDPADRVLEVGSGTGYQAALLSRLAAQIFTIERHEDLAFAARANLTRLGYSNVEVVVGDGTQGLPQFAPYNRIIVAAAAPQIPEPLIAQLADGGRMVIPVGPPDVQSLQLVRKFGPNVEITALDPCRFVPLIGANGFAL